MRKVQIFVLLVVNVLCTLAQDTPPGKIKYTPDFRFRDGIYSNFNMVRQNHPIPVSRIVTDIGLNDREFYEKITEEKFIVFYDDNGVQQQIRSKEIWGYARNGIFV